MRITLISTQLGMGGAENLVCNLADQFVARGHQVQLVSLLGEPVVVPHSSEVQMVNLRLDKRNPASWPLGLAYFQKAIALFSPDIVHAHSFHSIMLARLARPLLKFPKLISSGHSQYEGEGKQALLYRSTDFLSDVMTNISKESTQALIQRVGLRRDKVLTVYNGIDTDKYVFSAVERASTRACLGLHADDQIVLAIGRLSPPKDFPNLFKAIKLLEASEIESKSLKVLIAGTGPEDYRQELKNLIIELGLETEIRFLGVRRDIPALLSAADIFVLSSAWEGFGLVVAEAMACERVVVATDCGGIREVVGEEGFICPPRDPVSLAKSLREALALSPYQATALGTRARQWVVERFDLKQVAEQWLQLYRKI
ncbi:glycosyltransferase [Deinococcus sp. Marseille-Q6407]|uniref:glycosyltransferase n=1 Tax=Deinococcus sp. Marseille-Q6407 TaxID=2969223 RepID=UPI0021BE94B9|nr:glycosyltransferase [Deinococcus sp. Marseille-Q6407]